MVVVLQKKGWSRVTGDSPRIQYVNIRIDGRFVLFYLFTNIVCDMQAILARRLHPYF